MPGGVLDRGLPFQDRDERIPLVADAEQDLAHLGRALLPAPRPASPAATETEPPMRASTWSQSTCRPLLARSPNWAYGGARAGHDQTTNGVRRGGRAGPGDRCGLRRRRRRSGLEWQADHHAREEGSTGPRRLGDPARQAHRLQRPGAPGLSPGGAQGRLRDDAGRSHDHVLARGDGRQPGRVRRRAAEADRRQRGLEGERRRRADGGRGQLGRPGDVRGPPRRRPPGGDHRARPRGRGAAHRRRGARGRVGQGRGRAARTGGRR